MTSPPPSSRRRAWWAPSAGTESSRVPPDRLDVTKHAASVLTTPVSASTPSTSTSAAWASAVQQSQQTSQPAHAQQCHRPPYTPISPPAKVKDPEGASIREHRLALPQNHGDRSPRKYGAQPPLEYGSGRSLSYDRERLPGVREGERIAPGHEAGKPMRDSGNSRAPPDYEEYEIRLPPLNYAPGRGKELPHKRGEREERLGKGKGRAESVRMAERLERDDDDDNERSSSHRSQPGRVSGTSASPAPGAFNGWESATLYYHAIHRLPSLSVSPSHTWKGAGVGIMHACGVAASQLLAAWRGEEGTTICDITEATRNQGTKCNTKTK
ncbi:unnamed protein product [Cutaneotrichosporon oleaginosum]